MAISGSEELSRYNFVSKYARYAPELKRRESFDEAVERMVDMHLEKYLAHPNSSMWAHGATPEEWAIRNEIEAAFQMVKERKLLASQRMLQFGGKGALNKNLRGYNCSTLYIDRIRAFAETEFLLLCGCGVGYSIQKHHVEKLPGLVNKVEWDNRAILQIDVEDTIEGWADAFDVLIGSYFLGNVHSFANVLFDLSKIRPQGASLSTGGKAPGPEPLRSALERVRSVLDGAISRGDSKLRPIDCHDILCHMSDSVISGGVRRCSPAKTDCLTINGNKYIRDLQVGELVLTSDKTWQKVTAKVNSGVQKLYRIRTNLGDQLCTANHRWAVVQNLAGDIAWKQADELSVNDCLYFNSTLVEGMGQDFPTINDYKPLEMSPETAWFMGYFLGNGSVSKIIRKDNGYEDNKFRICVPKSYPGLLPRVEKLFERIATASIHIKDEAVELTCSRKHVANYFLNFKQPDTCIEIPDFIKQNSIEVRLAFLAGLLDSDGCVRNDLTPEGHGTGQISLVSTKYYDFAREVQALYASLGLPTKLFESIREDKSPEYVVKTISSEFRRQTIGWLTRFSVKLQDDYVDLPQGKEMYGIYYPKSLAIRGEGNKVWNSNHIISMAKLREKYGSVPFVPAVVEEIVPDFREEETFDIEVENNHDFFANGMLSHNSALIALFSPDDEEMMNCKTGDWFVTNPMRARANCSAVIVRSSTTKEDFLNLFEKTKQFGEPGFVFVETRETTTNPCQPKWAPVLTPEGLGVIGDIEIGDIIWSSEGWTVVTNKWSTGIKEVYRYATASGTFYGTKAHRIVSNGVKVPVDDAVSIDCFSPAVSGFEGHESVPWATETVPYKILSRDLISTEEVFDITVDNATHTYWSGGCNVSNCGEITLFPLLIRNPDGSVCDEYTLDLLDDQDKYKAIGYTYESGVQVCNLCEINGAVIKDAEDFRKVVKAAAIIGTLQAGYTDTGYLGETSRHIIEREALLGISITGMMDNPKICFDNALLKEMSGYAIAVNKEWAAKLGINPAARVTAIKPAGNSTILLGCQGSGIHPPQSRRLIRRVQTSKFDPVYQEFKLLNPHMCEDSVWSANKTDDVISFPVEVPEGAIVKEDLSAIDFLQKVLDVQANWIVNGTARPTSVEGATHNCSNTCSVSEHEWTEVGEFIWSNRDKFSGVSLLPRSGDFVYEQAPMQKIWFQDELVAKFGKTNVGAAKHVRRFLDDEFGHVRHVMAYLKRVLDGEDTRDVFGCQRGLKGSEWTPNALFSKHQSDKLWEVYTRIRQLIHLEDGDDIVTLLAAVTHEDEWNALVKDMVPVDYSLMVEEEDNTKAQDTIACGSGGMCDLDYVIPKEEK